MAPHDWLLDTMQYHGIRDMVLLLFRSYFDDRQQIVEFNEILDVYSPRINGNSTRNSPWSYPVDPYQFNKGKSEFQHDILR
ncbi:hypothetical protein WA026_021903 [Henosepilachna vigintioctopunctata]